MSPTARALLSLLPLIAFWYVESAYGLRAGVIAAMVLAAGELAVTWALERRLNRMTLFAAGLVGVFGGLTLYADDPRFMLLSPAVGDWVFAAILVGASARGTDLLTTMMQEQDPTLDLHPLEAAFFRGVGLRFAANLLVHAVAVCIAATADRGTWLFVSGPLQYGFIAAQLAGEVVYSRMRLHPQLDALEETP